MPLMLKAGTEETVAVASVDLVRDHPAGRAAWLLHRAEHWHRQIVEGVRTKNGMIRRDSVAYVAWLNRVSEQTVRNELERYRANAEAINDVLAAESPE